MYADVGPEYLEVFFYSCLLNLLVYILADI